MEGLTKLAWALLALLHLMPALVVAKPDMVRTLYGAQPAGEVGVLLVHRGALFLAVMVAAAYALLNPEARRLASLVVAISMVGFLFVYLRAGMPAGELRKIAVADAVGLLPLAWVVWRAWG